MTKPDVFAPGGGGDRVPDLHLLVGWEPNTVRIPDSRPHRRDSPSRACSYPDALDAWVYGGPNEYTGFSVNPLITIGPNATLFNESASLTDPSMHFSDYQFYAVNFTAAVPDPAVGQVFGIRTFREPVQQGRHLPRVTLLSGQNMCSSQPWVMPCAICTVRTALRRHMPAHSL